MIENLHDLLMSYALFDFAKSIPHTELLFFDVDATAVEKYGSQEGVEAGYVARDTIETCYQYLFFRLHNRNTFFYGAIRGGSTHRQNDFCGYLQRLLRMLKKRWQPAWCCDSGYFNELAFDEFSESDASFFIKAPMSVSRLSLANTSPDIIWSLERNGQLMLGEAAEYRFDCLATNDFTIEDDKAFDFYNGRANCRISLNCARRFPDLVPLKKVRAASCVA